MLRMKELSLVTSLILVACQEFPTDSEVVRRQQTVIPDIQFFTNEPSLESPLQSAISAWNSAMHTDGLDMPSVVWGYGGIEVVLDTSNGTGTAGFCGASGGEITIYAKNTSSTTGCETAIVSGDVTSVIMHEMAHFIGGVVHRDTVYEPLSAPCVGTIASDELDTSFCPHEIQALYALYGVRGNVPPTLLYDLATTVVLASAGTVLVGDTVTIPVDEWRFTAGSHEPPSNILPTLTWSSGNSSIAQILSSSNDSVAIQIVGEGTTNISAAVNGFSAYSYFPFAAGTSSVTGRYPVASVSLSPNPVTINAASTYTGSVTATLRDGSNNIITGPAITWSVDNPLIASIGGGGSSITLNGNQTGSTTVRATVQGFGGSVQGTATVNVTCPSPSNVCP